MKFEKTQLDEDNKSFILLKKKYKKIKKIKKIERNTFINIIKINKEIAKNIIEYIILEIPFILMDYFIREEAKKINFDILQKYSYIFSYTYIIFFVFSSKCFIGNIGKVYYSILFIFYFLLFLTNLFFFSATTTFFQFKILSFAGEGSHYMLGVIFGVTIKIWINILIIIFSFILAVIIFRKSNKNHFLILICFFMIFIFVQDYTKNLFGQIKKKSWDDFNKPNNLLLEFSNPNKCMKITGFYKFIQMDFFKTYLDFNIFPKKEIKEELEYLKNIYKDIRMHAENAYTGKFKEKNIIFVQLESMDIFLLNKTNTPTLHSLKNNSYVFTEHYSYKINAGSTFN